jgi:hypothetical protein
MYHESTIAKKAGQDAAIWICPGWRSSQWYGTWCHLEYRLASWTDSRLSTPSRTPSPSHLTVKSAYQAPRRMFSGRAETLVTGRLVQTLGTRNQHQESAVSFRGCPLRGLPLSAIANPHVQGCSDQSFTIMSSPNAGYLRFPNTSLHIVACPSATVGDGHRFGEPKNN